MFTFKKLPRILFINIFIIMIISGCHHIPPIKDDIQFARWCLKQELWKDAIIRYQRIIEQYPDYAAAHNNLAIAYEALGEFDKAKKEYETAHRLDPKNKQIKKNINEFESTRFKTKGKQE